MIENMKIWDKVSKDFNEFIQESLSDIDRYEDEIKEKTQKIEKMRTQIAEYKEALKKIPC